MIELKNVKYSYNDSITYALDNVSIKAEDGLITLCTGVSGCGKSTVIKVINSLCPNYHGGELLGDVLIDGQSIIGKELSYVSSIVGTLFQDPERQFFALNVEDEIAFALEWKGIKREEIRDRVNKALKDFHLEDIKENAISALSEGQKQKLGLACVVSLGVKNIILDEPTANLDPESTLELAQILNELKQKGYCIFVVDHRLYYLNGFADKVIVMSDGKVVDEGAFEILNKDLLTQFGLRKTVVEDKRKTMPPATTDKESLLSIRDLSFSYKNSNKKIFENLNLDLYPGIYILTGRNGLGKTTLSRLIFSLEKPTSGQVIFKDKTVKNPLSYGSIVLQNTDYQLNMSTVLKEIESSITFFKLKNSKEEIRKKATAMLELLNLSEFSSSHPQSLSGGQKQRLVIGCALSKEPKVLILDEPTSGLDGLNMKKIKKILIDYAAKGNCVIVITHDLEFMDDPLFKAVTLEQ